MTAPIRSCRDCVHCGEVEQGTMLVCRWEKNFFPPPVFRARLWGKDAPKTQPASAETCRHYEDRP